MVPKGATFYKIIPNSIRKDLKIMKQCIGCPLPAPLPECNEESECPLFDPMCSNCHYAETNCDPDSCWLKNAQA